MNKDSLLQQLVVITGAAGFIGSGVIRYLNDLGVCNLILVDALDHPDKALNLSGKLYTKLLGIHELFSYLKGRENEIGAIIHLGACSDTLETNPDFLFSNNTDYTRKLAEYALTNGIRFIYASSAATYGDGREGFSDAHELLENLKPLNLYGKSKHDFDLWAKKEGVLNSIVGLKYFNVFGPNENHKGHMASMLYKMVPLVQKEGVVRLFKSNDPSQFADGGQCRDFIYVKEAVRMTCSFLDDQRCGIFNIGMGRPTTWNQLARALFNAFQKPLKIEYVDMPLSLAAQYQNYTCAQMEKFAGGNPLLFDLEIEDAVQDYVNSYLKKDRRW